MEKIDNIEIYENNIELYIAEFSDVYNLPDIHAIPQNTWNALLRYIYKHTFKTDNSILKEKMNNKYNTEVCEYVCDLYIELCGLYDKEVSIVGYSNLTGISEDIIQQWGSNSTTYRNGNNKLSNKGYDIYKKLSLKREESLKNMLIAGKRNPVGILGILNHSYQWNMPGVSREVSKTQRLERSDVVQIEQKQDEIPQLPT